jgi:pimeloyl-ACP methyl ester carboxylesterase
MRHRPALRAAVAVIGLTMAAVTAPRVARAETVDFSRDIQPLLAKRCYSCHGPDTQEGGLRLDDAITATRKLDSGARAIVPSDDAASEILARITSDDPDVRMPPEGSRLTATQVEMLRRWITQGAEFREHWAFRPVVRPEPPTSTATNPIDAFIRDTLARRGLPAPSLADRRSLLRRATYGVTGLPPTKQETRDFLADDSPQAWEKFTAMMQEGRRRKALGQSMMVPRFDVVPMPEHLRKNLVQGSIMEFPFEVVESMFDFRAIDVVANIAPRPLLLMHPARDSVTPTEQSIELFQQAGQPADLFLLSGVDHYMFAEGNALAFDVLGGWLKKHFPLQG